MARNTGVAPNTFALWKKLLSWVDMASLSIIYFTYSPISDLLRLLLCGFNAKFFSARSSWLQSTPLPDDCYLSPRVNSLFQPLFVLAALEAILSPLCTVAFWIMNSRRETTYTEAILVIAMITISIAVAAIVLALQTLIKSSLDMQITLSSRPDLSREDVLSAWDDIVGGGFSLAIFILFLVTGGYQIMVASVRHVIPSSRRLPKQFQPYVMEKHKRRHAIREPRESTPGIGLVAGGDCGPLARFFDDFERRGPILTHIDLEVCQSNMVIMCRCLQGLHSPCRMTLPDREEKRPKSVALLKRQTPW